MALRSRHFTLPGSHCALRRRFRGGPPYEDIAFKIVNNECESPPTYICMHTHAYTRTHVHTAYMYMCIRACAHMCIGGSSRISGVSSPALSVASSSCTLASSAIATGAEHCTLHVAGCRMHAARCTLHAARCALHAARCRIHAAGYTLQAAARSLSPSALSAGQSVQVASDYARRSSYRGGARCRVQGAGQATSHSSSCYAHRSTDPPFGGYTCARCAMPNVVLTVAV